MCILVKGDEIFHMDDNSIVQLYWDRDEKAIAATSEKYGSYCGAIARNILGNCEDAQECVNDTYLNAWNAIPPHRPEVLSTFLGKITRNISFNLYKYKQAEKRGGGQAAVVLDELEECISGQNMPEDEVFRKELVEAINSFLASISVEKRKIFVCRYWYADSILDIAKKFGVTENSVSVTLNRLRKKLHSYLMERGFEL